MSAYRIFLESTLELHQFLSTVPCYLSSNVASFLTFFTIQPRFNHALNYFLAFFAFLSDKSK